ncbi:MAG: hypothetical protein HPZ97_09250 [Oscillospiraceae bacterium]|nr:hypothetical protein [Oscillospiraceae bacterium]
MQNKPKKHLPRLAVAAIIIAAALTLTAAAAAVVHRFRNDIIVSSVSELPAPTEDTPTAVAVVTDSQSAAQTLDEILAEGPYITAEEWETGEKIGGTTSAQYGGWDTAELISSDPALSVRRITRETDGAEKMQYMAEDPADLLPVLTGKIRFDLTWLAEHYSVVIPDDQAYIIRDEDGAFVSEYFSAAYGANDGKGWVSLDMDYDTTRKGLGPSYIVNGTFDQAYYYTTQDGYEFLITASHDKVWASCYTDHAAVSLYGAYLTTRDLEQIVEHLALSISE